MDYSHQHRKVNTSHNIYRHGNLLLPQFHPFYSKNRLYLPYNNNCIPNPPGADGYHCMLQADAGLQ